MISFFESKDQSVFAVKTKKSFSENEIKKLEWLFGNATFISDPKINRDLIGPRAAMVSPWSTNAVEICNNMGLTSVVRIEKYSLKSDDSIDFDPMLNEKFSSLTQDLFKINIIPEKITNINDIEKYNQIEGLSLSPDEISYLNNVSKRINRELTDSEIFGFSQVNSEHCRHKIFNGKFVIDGEEKEESLFSLIKKTSKKIQTI